MLGTGVYAEHLETYGHNGGKNSLTQVFNGQETEMYVYLSEKTRLGDELGEPNEYIKGADGSKGDLLILAGRQVCPYNIDDEYPISLNDYESGNLEGYGKSELTTTLVTLKMLHRGENEKISVEPEEIHCDLLQDDETQSDDASEQWESAETSQSVEVLMDVPTLEEWRHQGFDGTICLQGKMEDTIPGWFSRMNRKVLDKLTIRAAKLKSFCKTWMGARPKKYDYWAVLESMLRTDNMAYDYMMGTMGSASADGNSGEEPAVFMPEFQGIAERIRALSSALNIKEDQYYFVEDVQLCTEDQDADITNDNEQVCTETPLTPVVSPTNNAESANWKRPKPHIVFAGKETRVYHPFQSPSDYLAEVSHADSLAPGPLDIDTTCRQFKTKYKDLVIIYLRWDFVQKSGQSPGTGPFGWFFLMFSNGGTVPVYITERVHRVVFEKPDDDEADGAEDDVEMEWPEGLKMPVNNNKRWEGRSVYIPMDEFSKDLVCRSKEAAVERYYATLKVLEG